MTLFNKSGDHETIVVGLFCEMFSAAGAVKELTDHGFSDAEIDLIGFLNGPVKGVGGLLRKVGMPADQAEVYADCFEEGAILVMVRTLRLEKWRIARNVLRRRGGIFAPEI